KALPTSDMGQVRPDESPRSGPSNGVAQRARVVHEHLLSALSCGARGRSSGLTLTGEPGIEIGRRIGLDEQDHVRMLRAAVLGALSAEQPGTVRLQTDAVRDARNEIHLSMQARNP